MQMSKGSKISSTKNSQFLDKQQDSSLSRGAEAPQIKVQDVSAMTQTNPTINMTSKTSSKKERVPLTSRSKTRAAQKDSDISYAELIGSFFDYESVPRSNTSA